MLALDEQKVRFYQCMVHLDCVSVWCPIHCDTIVIDHQCPAQIHPNDDNIWIRIDFGGMYGWNGIVLILDNQMVR